MKKINLLLIIVPAIIIFGIAETAFAGSNPVTQRHYRWRNDDGTELSATWKAPEDTMAFGVTNENIRLRFAVDNNYLGSFNKEFELQYCSDNTNGPWATVPTTLGADFFVMTETPNYFNMEDTTPQLIAPGFYTTNIGCVEYPSNSIFRTINGMGFMNLEYCFQATELAWGSTNYFKVSSVDNIASNAYAKLIIAVPEPTFIIFTLFLIIWLKQKFKP